MALTAEERIRLSMGSDIVEALKREEEQKKKQRQEQEAAAAAAAKAKLEAEARAAAKAAAEAKAREEAAAAARAKLAAEARAKAVAAPKPSSLGSLPEVKPEVKAPEPKIEVEDQDQDLIESLKISKPGCYQVLNYLRSQIADYGAVACSYKYLQDRFSVSQATIARYINHLRAENYLHIIKCGNLNIYTDSGRDLAWDVHGRNKRYANIEAHILISSGDQN